MLETLSSPSELATIKEEILAEITPEKCAALIKSLVPTGQPGCGNSSGICRAITLTMRRYTVSISMGVEPLILEGIWPVS